MQAGPGLCRDFVRGDEKLITNAIRRRDAEAADSNRQQRVRAFADGDDANLKQLISWQVRSVNPDHVADFDVSGWSGGEGRSEGDLVRHIYSITLFHAQGKKKVH